MKQVCNKWLLALCLAILSSAVVAATPQDEAAMQRIRTAMHERYPKVTIKQISPAPIAGLYELVTDAGLAYIDSTGDHLFLGKILDTKTQQDLTEERWNALNSVPFDDLPLKLAIKFVKGNGKRRFAVFEDPHCPFCHRLETEIQKITDATVYVFVFPIESLHPGATKTSQAIWCAKDRATAWTDALLKNQTPPAQKCDTSAIDKVLAFGDKLNVNATPTLFFADGSRHAGAMSAQDLDKMLDAAGTKK